MEATYLTMKAMLVASLKRPFHSEGARSITYDWSNVVIDFLHSSIPSSETEMIVCTPFAATSERTVRSISPKSSGRWSDRASSA